jgi:Glycoside-hydrolase family GH114
MRTSSRSAGAAATPLITLVAVMLAAAACSPLASSSPTAKPVPTTLATIAPRITASPAMVGPSPSPSPSPVADGTDDLRLPPANAGFDYQLGGAYPPPPGVTVVSRDRTASPEPGLFNICYVNGFQVQPGEEGWWRANQPDLLLRDANGKVVIDRDWDEMMLDPTTAAKRDQLARVIGDWIAGCAADGFDAVEIDNLDTFTRTHGRIGEEDAVAQVRLYADAAHANGLAIAQKNSAEITGRREEMGTDFAVAEECNRWKECDAYTGAYGEHVLVIEYRRRDFAAGCAAYPGLSIILRDLDLVPKADNGYVYRSC